MLATIQDLLAKYGMNFLNGLGTTLLLALISVAIGCIFGALLAIIPMTAGYFVSRKLLRLPLLNGLGSLTASMTSTPALAMLVELSGTDDVAAPYATTYPIALITLVLTMQVLVNL